MIKRYSEHLWTPCRSKKKARPAEEQQRKAETTKDSEGEAVQKEDGSTHMETESGSATSPVSMCHNKKGRGMGRSFTPGH